MRLLIATPLYPPDLGGPATYARLLETGMPFPVVVVKFGDVRWYPKVLRHIAYFIKLLWKIRSGDIVLALDPVSVGLPALCAAKLRRTPLVVKIVGDYAWEQGVQRFRITDTLDQFVRRARVPLPVAVMRSVQTHVAKSAKKVIVPSQYLKGIVSAWGIRPDHIEVIYNAIELEEGGSVPEVVSALPKPLVVTVGRLVPWKRFDGVIHAVAALPHSLAPSLAIVGEGPDRTKIEALTKTRLGTRAIRTGALSHADTLAVIHTADVFVLNSTYEGLSHVLIEALMLGKPVIATDVGGNGELIRDNENGILVPVQDAEAFGAALERVLTDSSLRARLGEHASAARQVFSADTMRAKTAAFLTNL